MSPILQRNAIKLQVINLWLKGVSRDSIARHCNISTGSVSNVIAEWRVAFGTELAENLRDISKALRDSGITAEQCATGFRVFSLIANAGLSLEELDSFFADTYSWSKLNGINPQLVGQLLKDLKAFASTSPVSTSGQQLKVDAIRISEIPRYLAAKIDEKIKLEGQINQLQIKKTQLDSTLDKMDLNHKEALRVAKITEEQLKWNSELKSSLERDGIEVNNISRLAATVRFLYEQNYDASEILQSYTDLDTLKAHNKILQQDNANLERRRNRLSEEVTILEEQALYHQRSKLVIDQLDKMGFTLRVFKQLYGILIEIDEANGQEINFDVVQKFFSHISDDYDAMLGLEKKLRQLRGDVETLTYERQRQSQALKAIPLVGSAISSLLSRGVQEQEIVNISKISEMYPEGILSVIQKYKQEKEKVSNELKSLQQKMEQEHQEQRRSYDNERNQTVQDVESRTIPQFVFFIFTKIPTS